MEQARLFVYRMLETVFEAPLETDQIIAFRENEALSQLAEISIGAQTMVSSLQSTASEDQSAVKDRWAREYTRLFIGPGKIPVPLWESVYRDREHVLFGEQTIQVRNAYATYGLQYTRKNNEPEDHLALELHFMAWLIEHADEARSAEKRRAIISDQQAFLTEHLLKWTDEFVRLLLEASDCDFYRGAALLLQEFLSLDIKNLQDEKEEDGVC